MTSRLLMQLFINLLTKFYVYPLLLKKERYSISFSIKLNRITTLHNLS
jgi:hypothetical protein